MKNHTKALLERGEAALGIEVSISHLDVVEALSNTEVDWFWYDTEHAPQSSETLHASMQVARGKRPTPIVRVAWNDPVLIKKALDIGAGGIIVPWVSSREHAEAAVRAAKYPPQGLRGMGPRWVLLAGGDMTEYFLNANDGVLVVVQIETAAAIENREAILSTPGVDAYLIGPYDLSASMGYVAQPYHPKVEEAVARVLEAGQRLGVPGGYASGSPETARRRIAQGFQLVTIGADVIFLAEGCRAALHAMGRKARA